jgi:hypothetical protein
MSSKEIDRIYARMPPEDRARVDCLSAENRAVLITLWSRIERDETTGDELDAKARELDDERLMVSALNGKCGERARDAINARVAACPRVTGKTFEALKKHDRATYRRFLRGCTRALRREAAIADGSLSGAEVAELRRRYNKQREIDRYADEFPDFIDERSEVRP